MNFSEPTHMSLGARRAVRCLSMLLMSAPLPKGMLAGTSLKIHVGSQGGNAEESSPYLTAEGCPPLYFRQPDPAPEMANRPTIGGPPDPRLAPDGVAAVAALAPAPAKAAHDEAPPAGDGAVPASTAPIAILPDSVRPQLQAEDFLPFFVIPDSARTVGAPPVPPEPGRLPPSNATYTEK
jgi:hypothetical protein